MHNPLASGIAFFALGATFLGTTLLLLFNPRSRPVRWWTLFQLGIMLWLAAAGMGSATGDEARFGPVLSVAVHMLPALFLAFALADHRGHPWAHPLLAVALGTLLLPADLLSMDRRFAEPLLAAWNVVPWAIGSWLLWRNGQGEVRRVGGVPRIGVAVPVLLVLVFPIALIGGVLAGVKMFAYVMPLLMVWVQLLVFLGVIYLRFYDIEIRAARTGEIAADAAEQERLAVVGELSASLAHEIRNPLTGVRSLAQRLAEEEIDETRRRRYAGVILEEVGRVERLVTHLLGLARRAPQPRQRSAATPMQDLFDDLLLLLGARAERARVTLAADAGGSTALAAREPLAQALLNLLLNAIAHSPEGGTVRLAARETADGIEILVRDGGPGVAPRDRERIWEPFVSGVGGTGLGLAVVRRLAREHGWRTAVADAPGGGAEFRLCIASSPEDHLASHHPPGRIGAAPTEPSGVGARRAGTHSWRSVAPPPPDARQQR